eukprot:Nk52_evm10s1945 gene=Nk52_evmTU10s1945
MMSAAVETVQMKEEGDVCCDADVQRVSEDNKDVTRDYGVHGSHKRDESGVSGKQPNNYFGSFGRKGARHLKKSLAAFMTLKKTKSNSFGLTEEETEMSSTASTGDISAISSECTTEQSEKEDAEREAVIVMAPSTTQKKKKSKFRTLNKTMAKSLRRLAPEKWGKHKNKRTDECHGEGMPTTTRYLNKPSYHINSLTVSDYVALRRVLVKSLPGSDDALVHLPPSMRKKLLKYAVLPGSVSSSTFSLKSNKSCISLQSADSFANSPKQKIKNSQSGKKLLHNILMQDMQKMGLESLPPLPRILEIAFDQMNKRGLDTEGLFRVSGNSRKVKELLIELEENGSSSVDWDEYSIHDVAGVVKSFLLQLQEPLCTIELQPFFEAAGGFADRDEMVNVLRALCQLMPEANRRCLEGLLLFLQKVSSFSGEHVVISSTTTGNMSPISSASTQSLKSETVRSNKMTTKNLSLVFAPNILRESLPKAKSKFATLTRMTKFGSLKKNSDTKSGLHSQLELHQKGATVVEMMIGNVEYLFHTPKELLNSVWDSPSESIQSIDTSKPTTAAAASHSRSSSSICVHSKLGTNDTFPVECEPYMCDIYYDETMQLKGDIVSSEISHENEYTFSECEPYMVDGYNEDIWEEEKFIAKDKAKVEQPEEDDEECDEAVIKALKSLGTKSKRPTCMEIFNNS